MRRHRRLLVLLPCALLGWGCSAAGNASPAPRAPAPAPTAPAPTASWSAAHRIGPPSDGPRAELRSLAEDVVTAAGRGYDSHDSAGRSMDTAKIIADPAGGYLAVFHTTLPGGPRVSVATSAALIHWTHAAELGVRASQPSIAAAGGGFVVAWEQEPSNHLAFRYYRDRAALLSAAATRTADVPRTFSDCAEGTPNIYSVTLSPDIDHSTIDTGAHYFANCDVDRQQRGQLTNFRTWRATKQDLADNALLYWGVKGNIGDRDAVQFRGFPYALVEGQYVKGDFGSWRPFVYDHQTGNADRLTIRTNGGSTAFANPSVTVLTGPDGRPAIVFSLFVPSQGAARGEAGQLIYYQHIPAR
ncbi:MAG: hypothetical protein QOD41_5022 [Cryptosporangiaceae bacterium]|nr:hypothetical protein [Cryptosporangiaceae bacterium]